MTTTIRTYAAPSLATLATMADLAAAMARLAARRSAAAWHLGNDCQNDTSHCAAD